MKVTVTSSKNLQSTLKIVVEKKEIDAKIEVRLSELKNTINLKGFRPGKAPMELLKKQFGSSVYGEVAEKLLQESTFQALKEKKQRNPLKVVNLHLHLIYFRGKQKQHHYQKQHPKYYCFLQDS